MYGERLFATVSVRPLGYLFRRSLSRVRPLSRVNGQKQLCRVSPRLRLYAGQPAVKILVTLPYTRVYWQRPRTNSSSRLRELFSYARQRATSLPEEARLLAVEFGDKVQARFRASSRAEVYLGQLRATVPRPK